MPKPEEDGDAALDEEHPLPAVHVAGAGELHQGTADRPAENERHAHGEVDDAHHRHPLRLREPDGHDVHQRGIEAGLGRAEQEAQHVERGLALHEHHRGAQRAPGDGDPRDPPARPDLVHDQVARHLEQRVAEEEDPGAQAVRRGADPDVGLEGRLGQPDVGAVDEGHEVDQHQHRHQVQRCLPAGNGVEPVAGRIVQAWTAAAIPWVRRLFEHAVLPPPSRGDTAAAAGPDGVPDARLPHAQGVEGASVLEIGGGVGALQLELLQRGAGRTTNLELVDSYEADAEALAAEAGVADRMTVASSTWPRARTRSSRTTSWSCTGSSAATPTTSACSAWRRRTRTACSSTPTRHATWSAAILMASENLFFRIRGNTFRTFIHDPQAMTEAASGGGLEVGYRHRGRAWHVVGLTAPAAAA